MFFIGLLYKHASCVVKVFSFKLTFCEHSLIVYNVILMLMRLIVSPKHIFRFFT